MSLGENIKNKRKERKMSQEYIAEQLGVSRQAVSKWETGQSEPTTGNLRELAALFEIGFSELVEPQRVAEGQAEEKTSPPGKKENLILRTNLAMLAIVLQAGMLCACTQVEYKIVAGENVPDYLFMMIKFAVLALCSLWMASNLFCEKDRKQQMKNRWIETAYCLVQFGIAWCAYMLGMGFVGYALVAVVLVFYLLYVNPRYMHRPFGKKLKSNESTT